MNDVSTTRLLHPRPVRAPRGAEITCADWLIEAAYRMIQNNLDPEVAENPDALVVYGGIGKAARNWDCFDAILERCASCGDDETLLVQSRQAGRRVPHPCRRAARADRELEPGAELGDLGALQRARSQGPDDVRPDDRRLVDLHRQPGHRAGHLRNVRRSGPAALRRRSRRALDPDRRPRRHGRRAAAGRHLRRRGVADHRVPAAPDRLPPAQRATSTNRRATSTTRWRASRPTPQAKARAFDRPAGQCRRDPAGAGAPRRSGPTSSPIRPSAHDLVNGYLPPGWTVEQLAGAQADPARHAEAARRRGRRAAPCTCRRCSTFQKRACRRSTTATTSARSHSTPASANAFDFPGFVPAYIRPLFCRGIGPFRWVALSGDPEDIRKTDAKMKELFPRTGTCTAGSTWPASASPSRACRRASAGSASAIATAPASRSTRWSGRAS